jgi:GTPase SAR1 family protein
MADNPLDKDSQHKLEIKNQTIKGDGQQFADKISHKNQDIDTGIYVEGDLSGGNAAGHDVIKADGDINIITHNYNFGDFLRQLFSCSPKTKPNDQPLPSAIKGLMAFTDEDGELFLKLERGNELAQLKNYLFDPQIGLVVMMGESGAGKTSLLRAGLSHLLKVMRDYDLKRVISFHGRVQRAKAFADGYLQMLRWVNFVSTALFSVRIRNNYKIIFETVMTKVSEVSPRLYHYTTEQGLYGILDNQCLWATHYKFLNDYSEIELFRDKLIKELYPSIFKFFEEEVTKYPIYEKILSNQLNLDDLAKNEINSFVNSTYEFLSNEVYITSFTGEHTNSSQDTNEFINKNGLLSQWRAYGGDGGFAIIFKTCELEEMVLSEKNTFHYNEILLKPAIYSDEDKELPRFISHISDYIKGFIEMELQQKNEMSEAKQNEFRDSFIEGMTRYKHKGFKEEQEVRIVVMPNTINSKKNPELIDMLKEIKQPEKERKFRDKNGQQTPYIELFKSWKTPVNLFSSVKVPLPIEKIIVGPHKDKEIRAARLRVKLINTGIDVTVSEIPYQ